MVPSSTIFWCRVRRPNVTGLASIGLFDDFLLRAFSMGLFDGPFRRRARSVGLFDGPSRVGAPLGPGARVKTAGAQTGQLEGQQVMAGGDADPQYTTGVLPGSTPRSRYADRSASGDLKRPVSSRLPAVGALIAPGIWPALGSTGSTSPLYRSGARASSTMVADTTSSALARRLAGHWATSKSPAGRAARSPDG